ncbi:uncharacterized protein LOC132729482 [Ruditapes philippinarum]|uniref:uncharacterized protein LOC132729482 n=1 Tax=Ruditapes philippinarum TaxID=129788 RepID=UPI00295BEFE6|nr:uncharacterized protein LOC132729482 [Ruditapes philippinarum]
MDKTGKTCEMNSSDESENKNPKEVEESKTTPEQQTERPLNHLESSNLPECSGESKINEKKEELDATGVCPHSQSKQQEETGHVSRNLEHSEGIPSFQCCQPVCSILKGENDSQTEQMNDNVEEPEMDVQKGEDSDEVFDLTDNEPENESDLGAFYEQDQSVLSINEVDADDSKGNIENLKNTEIRSDEVLVRQPKNTKCLEKSDTFASIYKCSQPTQTIYDLWAVRISVSFIPAGAREEAYRFGTFCLRVDLERGISILLAREGFFCNNNSDIICAFCGRSLQQYHLRLGDRHLNVFLERHRHICNLAHNISMAIYGINLAHHVQVMQGNHDSLCVSGSHYQQQGVCSFAQQMRGLFPNTCIVPSGTTYNEAQRFLPWPNLVEHHRMDGNNSIPRNVNDMQMENQESNPHQDPPRENQSTTEHLAKTTKSGAPATTVQRSATLQADCFMTGATGTSADLSRRSHNERNRVRRESRRCVRYVDLEHADMNRRIASFNDHNEFRQRPRDMALAGLYHSGTHGNVRCFSCGVVLGEWKDDDVPLLEHIREQPECDFIQEHVLEFIRDHPHSVDGIVQAFVGSSIGTTVIGRGFTRGDVVDGIRRLLRNGERVTADSIICEINKENVNIGVQFS